MVITMKSFEYGDSKIGTSEMTISVTSMIIGIGILQLPRLIASATSSSDGWISILLAGIVAISIAWLLGKLSIMLHGTSLFAFTAQLTYKPVAYVFTSLTALHFALFTAYEVRAIGNISKHYLFERTPLEFVSLCFLWIIIYAVSGSSVGLIRLNVLFLPLVLFIAVVVLVFSNNIFHAHELMPFFISDWRQIASGAMESVFSLFGFQIILFYSVLMKCPQQAPKAAVIGTIIPIPLYLLIYIMCVGVFSHEGLKEITYPTLEIAKEVKIPGQFFERFESIFFTIWIMTIFNSAAMTLDICVRSLMSMFPSFKRMNWLYMLAPLIYILAMLPRNEPEFARLGSLITNTSIFLLTATPSILFFIAKLRRSNTHAK